MCETFTLFSIDTHCETGPCEAYTFEFGGSYCENDGDCINEVDTQQGVWFHVVYLFL